MNPVRARQGRRDRRAGVTLMEILVAISLLSLLSAGMVTAMRVGLDAVSKANAHLMDNRRVASVERILASQIAGLIPVKALCTAAGGDMAAPLLFFEGEPQSMRFVSTYSLSGAWRGLSQILEYQVIPGEGGQGVRLVVNEIPYTGPAGAGMFCLGRMPDPVLGVGVPRFVPIQVGPTSFVLADKLAACRFLYLEPAAADAPPPRADTWRSRWILNIWPLAVRIEIEPLDTNPTRLHPVTLTAPVRIRRSTTLRYGDYY